MRKSLNRVNLAAGEFQSEGSEGAEQMTMRVDDFLGQHSQNQFVCKRSSDLTSVLSVRSGCLGKLSERVRKSSRICEDSLHEAFFRKWCFLLAHLYGRETDQRLAPTSLKMHMHNIHMVRPKHKDFQRICPEDGSNDKIRYQTLSRAEETVESMSSESNNK